jgi:hypothetical protein
MANNTVEVIDNGVEVVVYPAESIAVVDVFESTIGITQAFGVVRHGTNANLPRPSGFEVVAWIGDATPVNAIEGDFRFRS